MGLDRHLRYSKPKWIWFYLRRGSKQCVLVVSVGRRISVFSEVPQIDKGLRSFLGMVQHYHPFLPDLPTTLAPLHELLKKGVQWAWKRGYQQAKSHQWYTLGALWRELCTKACLWCVQLWTWVVISHVIDDGEEWPIAYASWTLSSSERNYAQIKGEALVIGFMWCKVLMFQTHIPCER